MLVKLSKANPIFPDEDDGNGEVEAITEGIAALSSDGGEVAGRGRSEDDQLSGTIHSSPSTQRLTYCYFTFSG